MNDLVGNKFIIKLVSRAIQVSNIILLIQFVKVPQP